MADSIAVSAADAGPVPWEDMRNEPGTDGWQLLFGTHPDELVVRKTDSDAFASNAELASVLSDRQVHRIVMAGMQSNYCVSATSRGALRHGFRVELASGAHGTYDEDAPADVIAATVESDLAREGVTVAPAGGVAFTE